MHEQNNDRKIDLFLRVRPPEIARRISLIQEWVNSIDAKLELVWAYNCVMYAFHKRNIMYFKIGNPNKVQIGFTEGSKLKNQNLLSGRDKQFVRHFEITETPECKANFLILVNAPLNKAEVNKGLKLFSKQK